MCLDDRPIASRKGRRLVAAVFAFWAGFGSLRPTASGDLSPTLARSLLEEGDWKAAGVEARRAQLHESDSPELLFIAAAAAARQTTDPLAAATLDALADNAALDPRIRAAAAYESGRFAWAHADVETAFRRLRQSFQTAPTRDLFLRAGCSLKLLIEDHPALDREDPALTMQLTALASLWTRPLRRECAVNAPLSARRGFARRVVDGIIGLYRKQISPALGARCSLEPSCSEYTRQAVARHGLLGLAMFADRTFREPSVVAEKPHPRWIHGRWRYSDPLDDHDEWLRGDREGDADR